MAIHSLLPVEFRNPYGICVNSDQDSPRCMNIVVIQSKLILDHL
jgi:hypothetical protein